MVHIPFSASQLSIRAFAAPLQSRLTINEIPTYRESLPVGLPTHGSNTTFTITITTEDHGTTTYTVLARRGQERVREEGIPGGSLAGTWAEALALAPAVSLAVSLALALDPGMSSTPAKPTPSMRPGLTMSPRGYPNPISEPEPGPNPKPNPNPNPNPRLSSLRKAGSWSSLGPQPP